jgi:two-component system CheB/CheR fusion protein
MLAQRQSRESEQAPRGLVTFLDAGLAPESAEPPPPTAELVSALREELLHATRLVERMQQDHYLTNEDLRAANEELQSLNEQYRVTVEQLETSKEELQSANTQLQAGNQELKARLHGLTGTMELAETIFASIDVPVLFLDPELLIRRFTPRLADIIDLHTVERGLPLAALKQAFDHDLAADARSVMSSLTPVEREVLTPDERAYVASLVPCLGREDKRANGVVITFIALTGRQRAEATALQAQG